MTANARRALSVGHRAVLNEGSGLPDAIIESRGYTSLSMEEVDGLIQEGLFPRWLIERTDGWLSIPVYRPDGQHHCDIIRIDEYVANSGDPDRPFRRPKYLWPIGVRNAIDIHPLSKQYAADPAVPLVITEGVKKADAILAQTLLSVPPSPDRLPRNGTEALAGSTHEARPWDAGPLCVVAINGCWGWKSSPIAHGATVASPDWGDIALDGRTIIIVPDSDYHTNPGVRRGWDDCAFYVAGKTRMADKEPKVLMAVPPSVGLVKQGADDYLLDHDLTDLFTLSRYYKGLTPSKVLTDLEIRWAGDLLDQADDTVPTLVHRMFAEDSVNAIAGHTQTFKTWLSMILGMDASIGLNWHDHPDLSITVPLTKMLYVNKEMSEKVFGVRLRNLARHERYVDFAEGLRSAIAHTDEARIDFRNPDVVDILSDKIGEYGFNYCVLDTFSMVWSGDENNSSEVGALFMKLREITQLTHVVWIILHHLVKPSKDRAGINQLFHVRGSGQIIQQCDTALLLNMGRVIDEETKEITAVHAKGRLTGELPPWMIHYTRDRETGVTGMSYQGKASDVKAQKYAESNGDPEALADWIHSTLVEQPLMREHGMRTNQLFSILKVSWPQEQGNPPSDRTLRRTVGALVDEKILVETKNQRLGSLYNLAIEGVPMVEAEE